MSINYITLAPCYISLQEREKLLSVIFGKNNSCQIYRVTNFTEDVIQQQQQQNFSPILRCFFLAMMKFIEHEASQAKKLNQLVHIAS